MVRTNDNFKVFEDRLQKVREAVGLGTIHVEYYKADNQTQAKPSRRPQINNTDGRSHIDTHRWLIVMDTFADGIYKLNRPAGLPQDHLTHSTLPPELQKDLKVALIDDGANFMHKAIASKIENGRSFDSGSEDPDLNGAPGPFHGSTTGHGTYMVCPCAKVFVCRLDVNKRGGGEKAYFTAKSAADISLILDYAY